MFLDLKKIERDGVAIDAPLEIAPLHGPGDLPAPVRDARIWGTAVPEGRGVEFRGGLRARVELACSRCLRAVELPIALDDLYLVLVPGVDEPGASAAQDAAQDAAVFVGRGTGVDLVDVATEQIYLQLPLKPVCREDCKGLCATCGADRNTETCDCAEQGVDPRLAPLLQFRRPSGGV